MKRKLYNINKRLKNLRGHDFETSGSIAEESRSLDRYAVLAAHVTCPNDIVPDGVEFHAAFTTDHGMAHPLPPQPHLGGVRGQRASLASCSRLAHRIDAMMDDYVRPGRVRFVIQASLIYPEYEPNSKGALERLKEIPEDSVRLVGLDGPLSTNSCYRLVSKADVLLCPYHPATYRDKSSGTFTEAIAAEIPTVVPHGSGLSRQQSSGSGGRLTSIANRSSRPCGRSATITPRAIHAPRPTGYLGWLVTPLSSWSGHCWASLIGRVRALERSRAEW